MGTREDSETTRRKLLEAAGHVFAAVGFARASLRQIAARASMAVGVINYHFQSKAGLYTAVLRCAMRELYGESTWMADPAFQALPARERLCRCIHRALDDALQWREAAAEGADDWRMQLSFREMVSPTPQYLEWFQTEGVLQYQPLAQAVGEILGLPPEDLTVDLCSISIMGQILIYTNERPLLEYLHPELFNTPEGRQQLHAYIERACLAVVDVAPTPPHRGDPT